MIYCTADSTLLNQIPTAALLHQHSTADNLITNLFKSFKLSTADSTLAHMQSADNNQYFISYHTAENALLHKLSLSPADSILTYFKITSNLFRKVNKNNLRGGQFFIYFITLLLALFFISYILLKANIFTSYLPLITLYFNTLLLYMLSVLLIKRYFISFYPLITRYSISSVLSMDITLLYNLSTADKL